MTERLYHIAPDAREKQQQELLDARNSRNSLDPKSYWRPYDDVARQINASTDGNRGIKKCIKKAGGKRREGITWEDVFMAIDMARFDSDFNSEPILSSLVNRLQEAVIIQDSEGPVGFLRFFPKTLKLPSLFNKR
ncbi:MAG: hypothetical protein A2W22_04855 [Candidatus Levybacteria bacterium RBG_16_35_11]|nr:MAG: hypothetical protein A2W22_04855 [Candidatus Levybacteria bacterium RBG_16_35_11]